MPVQRMTGWKMSASIVTVGGAVTAGYWWGLVLENP